MMLSDSFDNSMRLLFVVIIGAILIVNSTLFEAQYGDKLIDLYMQPWWRILAVILIIAGAIWCPRVGIVIGLLIFFYLNDMETLVSPLGITQE